MNDDDVDDVDDDDDDDDALFGKSRKKKNTMISLPQKVSSNAYRYYSNCTQNGT